jgi:hypothetical protein
MRVFAFLLIAPILLAACIPPEDQVPPTKKVRPAQTPPVKTPVKQSRSTEVLRLPKAIVSAHVDAFNQGDVAGMSKMQHPDIEWFNISGSTMSLQASGRAALAKNMQDYFNSTTRVTGTLTNWSLNGDYVSVTETVRWKGPDGKANAQSALTVYQLEDNLIRRVWYYPSVEN